MSFAVSFPYAAESPFEKIRGNDAALEHFSIVFDGHLHNRPAVAAMGGAPGDATDAEVVLRAWAASPERIPRDLTGEFALVVFDARERTLLCARDHTGLSPFYWFDDGAAFHCSSEIDWFFTLPTFRARANEGYAAEWLAHEITTRVETLYDGLYRLPAATTMRVSRGGPSAPQRYWAIDFGRTIDRGSDEEYASAFREVFAEAVRCRCSDGRAAVALSGGLDSTSVAGMAHALGSPVDSYSLVFDEPAADERRYIDAAVSMFGGRSHLFAPAEHDVSSFQRQAATFREPPAVPNGYMSLDLMRAARADGVAVLMTGVGGDDWFDGVSPVTAAADLLHRGRVAEALRTAGMRGSVQAARALAGRTLRSSWPRFAAAVDRLRGRGDSPQPWITRSLAARVGLAERLAPPPANDAGFVASAMERRLLNGWQTFAIESERAAAARAGIELTHPFFDRRVIELAATLPEEQRFRGGVTRVVLRNAMRGLIPELVRTRTTKAHFNHLLPRALEHIGAKSIIQGMRIAELGWVDERRLRGAFDEMQRRVREGKEYVQLAWPIWMAISLEAWARTLP